MALRLRRSILLSSSLLKSRPLSSISSSSLSSSRPIRNVFSSPSQKGPNHNLRSPSHFWVQSHSFRSSAMSLLARSNNAGGDKIDEDTILFEGCDYNHWLITMEFPKDPKPTPEEMVETYVQTLAKVVGSVEEAKKRMYACSTTTYTGFQAVMTEEMSEKFRGLPGVVFILPDSYIDPVNKEYGGDKYINGTIIPRPPPVMYNQRPGRYGDSNRSNRTRYDRPRDPMPMQQGNTQYNHQNSMQGDGRTYMQQPPPPPPPPNNYGPPGHDGRGYNAPVGPRRDFNPSMGRGDFGQGERRDYGQQGAGRDYPPPGARDNFQGAMRDPMPSYQRDYNQPPPERRDFSHGERDPTPDFRGDNRPAGPPGNVDNRQGMGPGYGPGYGGPSDGQGFPQANYNSGMQGEQRNFTPSGQTGTNQGRY